MIKNHSKHKKGEPKIHFSQINQEPSIMPSKESIMRERERERDV